MRYVLLLEDDPEPGALPDGMVAAAMGTYIDDLAKAGVLLAAEGLQPSSTGVRIRFSGTRRTLIDGPFSESKLVSGYLVIEVRSREEAIAWAARCPVERTLRDGAQRDIEVRAVATMTKAG